MIRTFIQIAVKSSSFNQIARNVSSQSPLSKPTFFQKFSSIASPHESITSIPVKKRVQRKKKSLEDEVSAPGVFNVVAFATSEEYDLEGLRQGLKKQDLYEDHSIPNDNDVIHAYAKYRVEKEPREIFFYRDGGVVLWNITDLESSNVLNFVRQYEENSYSDRLVQSESEIMNYKYHTDEERPSCLDKEGNFVLSLNSEKENLTLIKYTFSNVMFLSVKLGIWEASLEKYIEEIEGVTQDLKRGREIKMSREEVLRKHGELFALRHYLNLSSDVLDTPDFYWENEQLESLYNQVCVYFSINKRTKVMNEKINHCVELIELLSHHLGDKHHIRLEWMIIILIMVEVMFEVIHYVDRYIH
ncbi:required for meiotic nuclear division protein 1 homolog [Anthonomus grandis grandis]|uniref:required for meiotic nuclear division protein 1 homolog n=1 Tax=Anthonomus grandis grandis TaxID=2921223 RepID=UPI002165788F|nr:required for meiotic nuclear division protein 1 homolog [Anthonomus grandis grandis]